MTSSAAPTQKQKQGGHYKNTEILQTETENVLSTVSERHLLNHHALLTQGGEYQSII